MKHEVLIEDIKTPVLVLVEEQLELLAEYSAKMAVNQLISLVNDLEKKNIQDFRVLYAKMVIAFCQQDLSFAGGIIDKALELYPTRVQELKALYDGIMTSKELTKIVNELIDSNQESLAIQKLKELHDMGIKNHQTDISNIKILVKQRMYKDAVKEFDKILSVYPQHIDFLRKTFGSLFYINQHHYIVFKAKAHLKDYLKNYPNDTDALTYFARTCRTVGSAEEEIRALERLTKLIDSPTIWFQYSRVLGENGDVGKSKKAFAKIPAGGQGLDKENMRDYEDLSKYLETAYNRNRLSRYPGSRHELEQDFKNSVQKYVLPGSLLAGRFIEPHTKFFAMGSCFAHNISMALRTNGYSTYYAGIGEEINSTYSNLFFLKWLISPNQISPENTKSLTELVEKHRIDVPACRAALQNTDVLIMTLGVAPCFFAKSTGKFCLTNNIPTSHLSSSNKYIFRTTTVKENTGNLKQIIKLLKRTNPSIKIFFTLSPVPLRASFEFESAVQADCLSKSTLRIAAHEILAEEYENIFYWPSFEIVRWLSPHIETPFGKDDQKNFHVNEALIDLIMDLFIENHASEAKIQ